MIFLFQVELFSKLLLASQNTEHGCSFSHKKFLKVAVRAPKMVEDAGLEPFFLLPGQACYRYHYILYIWQVASIRIFCFSRFRHQSVEVTLIIFVLNDIDRFFRCQQLV